MNKKYLIFGIPILCIALVSAVLTYYAFFSVNVNVNQPISVTGNDQEVYCDAGDTCCLGQGITVSNTGDNEKTVTVVNNDIEGIGVSYWIPKDYTYSHNIAEVQVDVTDEGEWLKWTYTYADNPTHTPKMTVAINYPDGFAITTFDDGSHDGWYYAPDGKAEVRLGDYAGVTTDWVETTANGNVLTVEILKSKLCNTFKWHGFANYNGAQVWINAGQTGVGYGEPPFVATLNEVTNPITVPKGSITFYPEFSLDDYLEGGVYNFGFEVQ